MRLKTDDEISDRMTDVERVVLEASALGEITGAQESAAPSRILIVPLGEVRSSSGSFLVDDEAIATTVAAFEEHGTDLPIDYEHQTLGGQYSSPTGQAPAAGWIKALTQVSPMMVTTAEDGMTPEPGLWAEVSWTTDAREKLGKKQYRYVSPVALVRKSDHRLVGIHSVALTNKPAIVGMRPIVNRQVSGNTSSNINSATGATVKALREVLEMDDSADDGEVLGVAVQRIKTLSHAESDRHAADRVTAAMAAGKLSVCQRDWAMGLARRDLAEFDRWAASAPRLVELGRTAPPNELATNRRAIESTARAEWRTNKGFLEKLCSEEAYVANALRDCEFQV